MTAARKARLYHRLQLAAHRAKKAADRALAPAGVTTAQAAVLAIVARPDGATQRDVAQLLAVNESAVTTMAARLIEAGFVHRARDAEDARAWRLSLAPAGQQAREEVEARFARVNAALETALTDDEIALLGDCLERIAACFDTEGSRP